MKHNYQERVDRGLKWLDENVPLWEQKVKLNELALESCNRCVLGFVFAEEAKEADLDDFRNTGFDYAGQMLFDWSEEELADLGFDVYDWEADLVSLSGAGPYGVLTQMWRAEIEKRVHA